MKSRDRGDCEKSSVRQDVRQPHESDELAELVRRMSQPDLALVPPGGELKPRESVNGHRVGVDTGHVAEDDICAALAQQRADPLAEPGQVGTGDGAADGEGDRVRPRCVHLEKRRSGRKKLIDR